MGKKKKKDSVDISLIYTNFPQIWLSISCKNENGDLNLVLPYVESHLNTWTWLDFATTVYMNGHKFVIAQISG